MPSNKALQSSLNQFFVFTFGVICVFAITYILYLFRQYIASAFIATAFFIPVQNASESVQECLENGLLTVVLKNPVVLFLALGAVLLIQNLFGIAFLLLLVLLLSSMTIIGKLSQRAISIILVISTIGLFVGIIFESLLELSLVAREGIRMGTSIDIASVFVDGFDLADGWLGKRLGFDILELSERGLQSIGVGAEFVGSASQDRFLRAINLLHLIRMSFSWSFFLKSAPDVLDSEKAMKAAKILALVCFKAADILVSGIDCVVAITTFFISFIYLILSGEPRRMEKLAILKLNPILLSTVKDFETALTTIIIATWLRPLFQIFGTFAIASIFGSKFPACFSILSAVLSMFPVFPPSLSAFLCSLELMARTKQYWPILITICHVIFTYIAAPSIKIPFANGKSYWAEASIAVGIWTFGASGVILGPFLASVPLILNSKLLEIYSSA